MRFPHKEVLYHAYLPSSSGAVPFGSYRPYSSPTMPIFSAACRFFQSSIFSVDVLVYLEGDLMQWGCFVRIL